MDNDVDKKAREARKFLDHLTEFLSANGLGTDELRESLRTQGVDPDESLQRFRRILSEHAPTWRERAARARASMVKSFETGEPRIPHRTRSELEREIREIVESMLGLGAAVEVGAYHRKFEEARDEDLESLLDDLRLQREWLVRRSKKAD